MSESKRIEAKNTDFKNSKSTKILSLCKANRGLANPNPRKLFQKDPVDSVRKPGEVREGL